MRISTLTVHENGIAAIQRQQRLLDHTQMQVAIGKRILTPADDPSASAQTVGLGESISRATQHLRNGQATTTRLGLAEGALGTAADMLVRVKELAVSGLNGTRNAQERAAIAQEVRQHLQGLISVGNSKDGAGQHLFAGFYRGAQPAFVDAGGGNVVYNGDQGARTIEIAPDRRVRDGENGYDVFMKNGSGQSIFAIVATLAAGLEANAPATSSLTDLDTAMAGLASARGRLGANMAAIESTGNQLSGTKLQLEQVRGKLEDLDYAEAIGRLNREMAGLEAAQKVYAQLKGMSLFNYL